MIRSKGLIRPLILSIAVALFSGAFDASPARSQSAKRVLFISSYHPSFPTFFPQIEGIRKGFEETGFDAAGFVLDIEFMDSKRFPGPEQANRFHDNLAVKLTQQDAYDVIIVGDDNALLFGIANHAGLLTETPLVFLGVNDIDLARRQSDNPLVSGVVEAVSMAETIGAIERILEDAQQLTVVADATRSSRLNLAAFEKSRPALQRMSVEVISLGDMTYDEFAAALRALPERTAILLLGPYRDKTGATKTYQQGLRLIQDHTPAPVFSLWSHGMGSGVLERRALSLQRILLP